MEGPITEALAQGRRATLEALRVHLAGVLDGTNGHQRGCECECGIPWDAGKVPAIARELRLTLQELEDLPESTGESELDRARREREERRSGAQSSSG